MDFFSRDLRGPHTIPPKKTYSLRDDDRNFRGSEPWQLTMVGTYSQQWYEMVASWSYEFIVFHHMIDRYIYIYDLPTIFAGFPSTFWWLNHHDWSWSNQPMGYPQLISAADLGFRKLPVVFRRQQIAVPSGELTFCNGKIHHFSWENPLFLWPFSIAILT